MNRLFRLCYSPMMPQTASCRTHLCTSLNRTICSQTAKGHAKPRTGCTIPWIAEWCNPYAQTVDTSRIQQALILKSIDFEAWFQAMFARKSMKIRFVWKAFTVSFEKPSCNIQGNQISILAVRGRDCPLRSWLAGDGFSVRIGVENVGFSIVRSEGWQRCMGFPISRRTLLTRQKKSDWVSARPSHTVRNAGEPPVKRQKLREQSQAKCGIIFLKKFRIWCSIRR